MKKFFSLVLALVMALSLTTVAWGADDPVVKEVNTAADLLALSATALTGNNGVAEEATIVINDDIDMQNAEFSAIIAQRGDKLTIVGNGHTISNVKVVSGENDNTTGQASMFYTYPNSTLTVSNLTLENITVTADADASGYAAAVVGYCEGTVNLSNVDVVNATVTGVKSSGMLVGHLSGSLVADGCDLSGTVTLADFAGEPDGHYAGKYIGTLAGNADVTNCPANVTVSGNLKAGNNGDGYGRPVSGDLTVDGDLVGAVAEVNGTQYKSLQAAIAAAAGGTVKLLDDVTLTGSINVTDAVTIDGNNKTVTMTYTGTPGTGNAIFNANNGNEGIDDSLTVKNLKMVMTGATKQGYAVVAKKADSAFAISFTGCHFENMWCGVMLNGCGGTVAPTVTITDSSFKDVNYGLSFAEEAYAGDVSFENNTMTGEISIQETFPAGSGYLTTPTVEISSGSFTSDVTDYLADGMSFVDGTVVKAAGQFVGSGSALTSSKATYGATLADALANKTHTVEVKAALEASASLKSFQTYQVFVTKLDDKTVSVLPNQYIVVPTATNADIVVVDGNKIVYLAAVAGVTKYNDAAKAVKVAYNADPDCGDVYVAAAADAGTYYLYKNAYYVECAESSASIVFNVDGVAVYAKATPVVKTLPHTYGFDVKTVAGKTSVTSVYCTECKATFSFVVGDVEDAVKTFGAGNYADIGLNAPNGDDIFVRIAVVSVPVGSTTLVESAETFDAGIAMYVGMSVMAAAGSAVVIGKKKD